MMNFQALSKQTQAAAIVLPLAIVGGFLLTGCGAAGSPPDVPRTSVSPAPAPEPTAAKENLPDGWKMLTSQAGNYEIMMPVETENTTMDVPSKLGGLKTHMVTASLSSPDTAYISSYVDYPSQVDKMNKEKMLDDARSGVASKGRKLVSEKQIEMDGFPGRELVVTSKEKSVNLRMDARMFLVNRRLYQFLVVSTDGNRPKNTDDFLDSFKFLKTVEKK